MVHAPAEMGACTNGLFGPPTFESPVIADCGARDEAFTKPMRGRREAVKKLAR